MSGFDANVPARKPRTQIARVLTELTADAETEDVYDDALPLDVEEPRNGASPPARYEESARADAPRAARFDEAPVAPAAPAPAEPAASHAPLAAAHASPAEPPRIVQGRERVNALRERLAAAARPPAPTSEPRRTAATVMEVVRDLRARLDDALGVRAELEGRIDQMAAALARTEGELARERKLRQMVEEKSDERAHVAEEAVAEAEALAAERDQVLAELAEQRRLDDEQAELLAEAAAALAARDQERADAARQAAQFEELLEARAAEIGDLQSRIKTAGHERRKLEKQVAELEAEVRNLSEAREALDAIEATVTRSRTKPAVD